MTESTPKLSAEEAMAIDAISGAASPAHAATPAGSAPPDVAPADPDHPVEPHFDVPVEGPGSQGYIGAADATEGAHDEHAPHEDLQSDDADMVAMRSAMLESAELANRAAGMAAKAAADMHHQTGEMHAAAAALVESHNKQRINGIVVLATFGALMLCSMVLFGMMSYRLQSRITQADAMLLAVGKRIVSMNESMELITGAGETLRDISSRQDTIVGGQMKLDARLDEIITATAHAAAQAASKPVETKGPDIAKLIQALDTKIQNQATALNALSSQVRTVPAPRPDPAVVKREVETALRQQKAAEAASKPVVVTPPPPPPAPAPPPKPKETLVQYPRVQAQPEKAP